MEKEFSISNLKIALVHDFLNQYGGAERVLLAFHEIFPDAPIYVLLHDKEKMREKFRGADIRTSFLRRFPRFLQRRHKWLLPFMPTAPETFNLRDYDLVISSSSAFAKGVVVKPKTLHICYCHTPMRYVWDWNEKYLRDQKMGKPKRFFSRMVLNYIRMWDRVASDRVDHFIANSRATASRIRKYYRRESVVVYPPADVSESKEDVAKEDFFLIVSRLVPYKKIEIAIESMNKLNLPLVVIGEGSKKYLAYLKRIAGPKIKFIGWKSDEEIKKYYRRARAFLFPSEDDFGITPVEAMAEGTPVLALRKGGATETIIEGETGEFFNDPTIESMADGIRRLISREKEYDSEMIKRQAQNFSNERFRENILKVIENMITENKE